MTKWIQTQLGKIANVTMGQSPKSEYYNSIGEGLPFLQGNRTFGDKYPIFDTYTTNPTKTANAQDIIMSVRAPVGDLNITPTKICLGRGVCSIRMKNNNQEFLYYLMRYYIKDLLNRESGTVFGSVNKNDISGLVVNVPECSEIQNKIASVLFNLDNKIELNNKINNNLEQQAQALFNQMFLEDIISVYSKHHLPLSELVQNIDNRGKTPPISPEKTDFPIIDVRALSGNTRIINYDNCTKFVSQETYLTGFRSGLPQKYDILLSTVGSLGEIKLFIEPKGCIAQNVIGYRSQISPLYLYQYLKTIKNDLLAYDIGSVQPSIKVTHIAKHPIFIPNEDILNTFHAIAEAITNKIYINSQENTRLAQLRDTLLPKLMSGEIDVSKVNISADKLSFTEE